MSETSYPSIAHRVEMSADHPIAFGYNLNPSLNVILCSLSVAEAALTNMSLTARSCSLGVWGRGKVECLVSSSTMGVAERVISLEDLVYSYTPKTRQMIEVARTKRIGSG